MTTARAVLVLGMHRSGTSAIARGLVALSVYMGDDFLDAQPENPTGYWEDRGIVDLNERLLKRLRLTWHSVGPIDRRAFGRLGVRWQRRDAVRYLERTFGNRPLWGFKDPRTLRVLPFWTRALAQRGVRDSYVVAIRNPRSVAASLYARQAMDDQTAHRLWLAHAIPFLREIEGKPFVVVDYDLFMQQSAAQLERIHRGLKLEVAPDPAETRRFASEFLDTGLRHSLFSPDEFETKTPVDQLTKDAYLHLRELAANSRAGAPPGFWDDWQRFERRLEALTTTG